VQYAENPPKKYQDIYPFEFETEAWPELYDELKSVFEFWRSHEVSIFRVDNPHTKPFAFWEWAIGELKREHPELIFLSEAFTRPRVMHRLAKLGFTQSYTYFTWRNTKPELIEYFSELSGHPSREYFRPNVWPNTPDILHATLVRGGRPAFQMRLVLAATLSSLYGMYSGYELCENVPVTPTSEEYLDSEKYEIKARDWSAPGNLVDFVTRINAIRRDNPALQLYRNLRFHTADDPNVLWYEKATPDGSNVVFVAASMDPTAEHGAMVEMPIERLGLAEDQAYGMRELLSDVVYQWRGRHGYVRLVPDQDPAQIFRLER
jgi:starch synthase (maltosyl-transferring)